MAQRKRRQKQTILVYCEGLHDVIFMKHLKRIYAPTNSSIHFEIKTGNGGSPVSIVRDATNVLGSFDVRIAKFDNDMGEIALCAALRAKKDTKAIYCTPAIEATLLEILEPNKSYRNYATQTCKRRLHAKYLSEADRTNPQKYDELYGFDVLNEARLRQATLNHLIEIFEKGAQWKEGEL